MTRKDYEAVADKLAQLRLLGCDAYTLELVTYGLADIFGNDNSRFDEERFYKAAGLVQEVNHDHA